MKEGKMDTFKDFYVDSLYNTMDMYWTVVDSISKDIQHANIEYRYYATRRGFLNKDGTLDLSKMEEEDALVSEKYVNKARNLSAEFHYFKKEIKELTKSLTAFEDGSSRDEDMEEIDTLEPPDSIMKV